MTTIISFSIIVWIFIDRIKKAWEHCKHASLITSALAFGIGALVSFLYKLDLLTALEIVPNESIVGYIFTALAIMGGSSCIAEIIGRLKEPFGLVIEEDTEDGDEK